MFKTTKAEKVKADAKIERAEARAEAKAAKIEAKLPVEKTLQQKNAESKEAWIKARLDYNKANK